MKTIAILKYVFTLVGMAAMVGALFLYQQDKAFVTEATKTEGTVVALTKSKSTYRPVIQFIDHKGEKVEFLSLMGSNPPSYFKGQKVEVLYQTSEPQNAKINGFFSLWGGEIIFGGIGALFFLVGTGIIVISRLKASRDRYLKEQGVPIETEFQHVEVNQALKVNGRNPFRIVTHWQNPETSNIHIFRSNNLWFNPEDYIKNKQMTVYIERNNPKRYYVDLSFLPHVVE